MFQPGVDPALPQALPEAPFAAGGGGARRRVSALQGGGCRRSRSVASCSQS